ncbi:hypothetical protein GCM10011507_12720 [Edaphobacter acidisoli]|uniref:Uncharacterized protein n=1 Tax=Edaphobacter acidisoli TaxID=2040573 RepID=A0A916W3C4_9BACT|nr:hypothetical protein [Edaphobacter acidisoli]GGA62624.1 hypothetical protein GCM10011507_12720 [Edaphobacter acidisoli]
MKAAVRIALGAMLTLSPVLFAQAPVAAAIQPVISFQFERTGLPVPKFTIKVEENGSGTYQADVIPGVGDSGSGAPAEATQHVNRAITLTPATVAEMFKTARALKYFSVQCDSKAKNIANTGAKTLSYSGADGHGSCSYNYSENKDITSLTNTFLAIAFTLDEGRRLAFLHRFDRLGLDAEINTLADQAKSGGALELGTIAPTLSSIASDDQVMERVRVRASRMLEQVKAQ